MGGAIAWRLHEAGLGQVRWILPAGGAHENLHPSATLIAPQLFHAQQQRALPLQSLMKLKLSSEQLLQHVAERTGFTLEKSRKGSLLVAYEDKMIREWGDVAIAQRGQGLEAHLLDPFSVRDVEPHLGADLAGAIYLPEAYSLRRNPLFTALESILSLAGVQVERGIHPLGVETISGQVKGLRTRRGTLQVDELILCESPQSIGLLQGLQLHPGVSPMTSIQMELAPESGAPQRTLATSQLLVTPTSKSLGVQWTSQGGPPHNVLTVGELEQTATTLSRLLPKARTLPMLSIRKVHGEKSLHGVPRFSGQNRFGGLHYALGLEAWEGLFLAAIPDLVERRLRGIELPEWSRPLLCMGERQGHK